MEIGHEVFIGLDFVYLKSFISVQKESIEYLHSIFHFSFPL